MNISWVLGELPYNYRNFPILKDKFNVPNGFYFVSLWVDFAVDWRRNILVNLPCLKIRMDKLSLWFRTWNRIIWWKMVLSVVNPLLQCPSLPCPFAHLRRRKQYGIYNREFLFHSVEDILFWCKIRSGSVCLRRFIFHSFTHFSLEFLL